MFECLPRPTKKYHNTTYERIAKRNGFDGHAKTILITGGAGDVGLSICHAFAEAGVTRIAIVSRSAAPQQKAKAELEAAHPSTQILTYQASVTDHDCMAAILHELGTIDVLILAAASIHRRANATELSMQEMRDSFDTNVLAPFTLTKAYLATPLPASGHKTVINISSAVVQVSRTQRAGYGSSKAAAAQLMQHFAAETAPEDCMRVFSFHPGALYTAAVAGHFPKEGMLWDEVGLPADFALWLAGPESGFLHGRHVWANWDVDELVGLKGRLLEDPSFLTVGLVL